MLALAEATAARDRQVRAHCCCSAPPERARPRCWRGASPGSPRRASRRSGSWSSPRPGPPRSACSERVEVLLDGSLRGALDRNLGDDRRASPARALHRRGPRSLLRRPRPRRAAGDAARPPRRAARCATRRSAATRPGLLARLLAQIDELKAGTDPPEPELAEFCAAHDRILAEAGSLDRGDVFLTLNRLLARAARRTRRNRLALPVPDGRRARGHGRRPAGGPLWARGEENPNTSMPWMGGERLVHRASPDGEMIALEQQFREPTVRFWRCTNERAQAQAVAREVEHLLADGTSPEEICVLVEDPAAKGGPVAAAMEERGIPFHLSRAGGAVPAARGSRCDRLAAGARRSRRFGGGCAGADPPAGRAALGRPGAADDDRPAPQARHGLRLRGGAGEPADPARGAGADPGLPQAATAKPRRRWRSAAPTSSCGG